MDAGKASKAPVIGIDLGMTSVVAAYLPSENAEPILLRASAKQAQLPAVVAFKDNGQPVVGRAAREMITTDPENAVVGIKRLLGRAFDTNAVRELQSRVGYRIVEGPHGEAQVQIQDRQLRITELVGILFDQLRRSAEQELGLAVGEAVIAVPAYFGEAQKQAVREAAKLARLEVRKLVHEPTAAALAYGFSDNSRPARILVVDLGGFRLDVSVMEVSSNVFDIVSSAGDPFLGGVDIDRRITQWVLSKVLQKTGRDLSQTPQLFQKVKTAAELAKQELAHCRAVDLQLPLSLKDAEGRQELITLRLRQTRVRALAQEVVDAALQTVAHALSSRGFQPGDIDTVILSGGSSRLPQLAEGLAELTGVTPRCEVPPEFAIAFGAARLAESLKRAPQDTREVLKQPIGIALADGRFMRIIEKDSRLPITRRVMIPTVRDQQQSIEVDVFQGEEDDIIQATYLGSVVFSDIEPQNAGEGRVTVDLSLSEKHLLTLTSPEPGRDHQHFEMHAAGFEAGDEGTPQTQLFVAKRKTASAG